MRRHQVSFLRSLVWLDLGLNPGLWASLNVKTDLFQAIQFCRKTQFSSFLPIVRTLSGATTLGQSGPRSNGNEGVLHIPQSSSITGTSPSDCLVSYPGHLKEF